MGSKNKTKIVGLETAQLAWERIGTIGGTAGAADAVLGVTERFFSTASALDNSVYYTVPKEVNLMSARFLSATADADMVVDIWAVRVGDDDMARVCTVTVKTGTQTATDGNIYADTATVSNNNWLKTVYSIVPAAEHQAQIYFDSCGYDRILFHANTTCDEDFIVECSGN